MDFARARYVFNVVVFRKVKEEEEEENPSNDKVISEQSVVSSGARCEKEC